MEPMSQICFSGDPMEKAAKHSHNAIYIGTLDSACRRESLTDRNIRLVISILHESADDVEEFEGIDYWRSPPVNDNPGAAEKLESVLDEAHQRIDAELAKGNSVLVHCMMGISRSPSVVASYVMRKHKISQ